MKLRNDPSAQQWEQLLEKFNTDEGNRIQAFQSTFGSAIVDLLVDHKRTMHVLKHNSLLLRYQDGGGEIDYEVLRLLSEYESTPLPVEDMNGNHATLSLHLHQLCSQDDEFLVCRQILQRTLEQYDIQFNGKAIAGLLEDIVHVQQETEKPDVLFSFVVSNEQSVPEEMCQIENEVRNEAEMFILFETISLDQLQCQLLAIQSGNFSLVDKSVIRNAAALLIGLTVNLKDADQRKITNDMHDLRMEVLQTAKKNPLFKVLLIHALKEMREGEIQE